MEEDRSGGGERSGTSPSRNRKGNRASYNTWASQRQRGSNNTPHRRNSESTSNSNTRLQNQNSVGHNETNSFSSDTVGLNGIPQLLDEVDSNIGEALHNSSSTNHQGSSVSQNNTSRRSNFPSTRGQRARGRRTIPRSDAPGNSNQNGRNQSPSRSNRINLPPGQRVPPLRFPTGSLHGSFSPTSSVESPSLGSPVSPVHPPLRSSASVPSSNPFMRGLGTEEEPYELSPGLPDVPSSPLAFGDAGNLLSDEEIARQLQQEEWEGASSRGDDDGQSLFMPPPMLNMFNIPGRRSRVNLPPLRRRGERSNTGAGSEESGGSNSGPCVGNQGPAGNRPPGRTSRSRGPQPAMHPMERLLLYPSSLRQDREGLGPFILNLFQSGIPDFEFEAFLNPDALGEADLGNYESLLALAERVGEVNRGMSDSDINKLPTSKHQATSAMDHVGGAAAAPELPQCNICLSDYNHGDQKRILPCKHDFHKDCVDQWLKTSGTCPVCRSDIKPKRS